ncbi:MAG TPA: hypothetical protein VIW29_08560 [Polyangiaceae bacterium]
MVSRRVHSAPIAAASDGSVLINVAALLPPAMLLQLGKRLGGRVFVGVALSESDAGLVVARLDDAAAEASAQVLGARPSRGNRLKSRKAPAGKAGAKQLTSSAKRR